MPRPLLLTGFMATGKTTVGRRIAELSGRRFVDLDQQLEQQAGCSIAELFRTRGESHFRALELAALQQMLQASDAPVVALGGGALLHRPTRLQALEAAVVVSLRASAKQIAERAAGAGATRPLLGPGENQQTLETLLAQRELAYAEAHTQLSTDEATVEQVARAALEVWQRDPIAVAAGLASYAVDIEAGVSERWLARELHSVARTLLISDHTVMKLYGEQAQRSITSLGSHCAPFAFPAGEAHKNPGTLHQIWQHCLAAGADRKSVFFGLGGGVVTDITGFAAATWMRGVRWIAQPTTLLSMVDASVGGKTAVDLGEAKNAVGAFWQPQAVLCDIDRLASEPMRGFRSALAEVVKTALIGDPALLELLEENVEAILARDPVIVQQLVRRSVAVKASVVSRDEREAGLRAALNLGHTLGHALEAHGGYGHLTHGEAISLGLVAALGVGRNLGVSPESLLVRVRHLLQRLGLPVDPQAHGLREAAKLVGYDKKRTGGQVRFVLVSEPGQVVFKSLTLPELESIALQLP